MKKVLSAVFLIVILFTLIFFSCKKESKFSVQETSLINSAKSWYESNVKTGSSNTSYLEPIWSEAKISESDRGQEMVIVPANGGNKTNNPKYGMVTSFIFHGHEKKIDTGNIVQLVAEGDYIKEQGQYIYLKYKNRSIEGVQNGALILNDINHNYLRGYSIKDGLLSSTSAAQFVKAGSDIQANSVLVNGVRLPYTSSKPSLSPSRALSSTSPSTFSTQGESNCTDWYWTTWNTTTGQIISEQYLYTSCETNTGGGNTPPTGSANPPPPCADSFHFVTKIPGSMTTDPQFEGGWQIAAIKNIRLKFVGTASPSYTIQMPTLYFGLPVVKKNGSNYEQYTYEKAQRIASTVVGLAEKAAYAAYKSNWPQEQVELAYKAALVTAIAEFGGTVTNAPGLNIIVPAKDITEAEYPGLFGC